MVDFICDYHKSMEQHPVLPAESLQVDPNVLEACQQAGMVACRILTSYPLTSTFLCSRAT